MTPSLQNPSTTPWGPCETWKGWSWKCPGWWDSLTKQLILNCRDFLLRSIFIFLIRNSPVLDFVFSVQSCRKVDWRSISGTRFWGRRPSDGRSRTCRISRFIHPSGSSDECPGSSVWSPGMPDWSLWSSGWRIITCCRQCLSNGPGLGVWSHTPIHPTLHESPHWHEVQ